MLRGANTGWYYSFGDANARNVRVGVSIAAGLSVVTPTCPLWLQILFIAFTAFKKTASTSGGTVEVTIVL